MPSAKLMLLAALAARAGFKVDRGYYYREWPSDKQWSFSLHGTDPRIQDEYGRIIRTKEDGITVIGMLTIALNHKD